MTRAAIYARYSSDRQRDASIEDQVRVCRRRIAQEGWAEGPIYTDHAISGASHLRPGYQKLLEDVRAGRVEAVVAESLDRLSRDQEHVAALFKLLSFHGIPLVTVGEGAVTELHVGLKGTMSALYLKDLADKTRRGLEGRVRQGPLRRAGSPTATRRSAASPPTAPRRPASAGSTRPRRRWWSASSRRSSPARVRGRSPPN